MTTSAPAPRSRASSSHALLLVGIVLLLAVAPRSARCAPGDFDLVATAGGRTVGSDNVWVHITATGQGTFERFRPDTLTAAPLDSIAFSLTGGQLDTLWQTVTGNSFFSLAPAYADSSVADGSFASLTIHGSGMSGTVTVQTTPVPGFDAIMAAVNALLPAGDDLVYDAFGPQSFTPQDGCGGTEPYAIADGLGVPEKLRAALAAPARPASVQAVDSDHPGTTVAYHMSLDDAIARGIATLKSKGGFYGDQVSITIDNTAGITTYDLRVDLYLDLYGPVANPTTQAAIGSVIASVWNGHTTTAGATLGVQVDTQLWPGVLTAPGTAGFHQILLGNPNTTPPVGRSYAGIRVLNQGATVGGWSNLPIPHGPAPSYAHEAGHLMGLPDRYTNWLKQPDGSWSADGGATTVTGSELAPVLQTRFPTWSLSQIEDLLADPAMTWVTTPFPGHEADIMGMMLGTPLQSDIDAIASQAGLVVDVPAGEVFVNKNGLAQNLMTTRERHVFVARGQVRTINGLWTACIDKHRVVPTAGVGFDLAPPLSQWSGPAAAAMLTLVNYVNQQRLYCATGPQFAIWDLTDPSTVSSSDSALFAAAGISLPLPTGFPHLSDPDASSPGTYAVVPPELLSGTIGLSPLNLVTPPTRVGLAAVVQGAGLSGLTSSYKWSLAAPVGSGTTLSSTGGAASSFVTDVHGTYRVGLHTVATGVGDTVTSDVTADAFCADAYSETFESGAINSGAPFHWVTAGDSAWVVLTKEPHTGARSAIAAAVNSAPTNVLSTTMTFGAPGTLEFAYGVVASDTASALDFLVDGVVDGAFRNAPGWGIARFTIPSGIHTLTWRMVRGPGGLSDGAALDDIAFPLSAQIAGVGPAPVAAGALSLGMSRPNPVTSATRIPFGLPRAGHVRLTVYDLLGRLVAVPADDDFAAGEHEVAFDASRLPPGVYTVRMVSGSFRATRTLVKIH